MLTPDRQYFLLLNVGHFLDHFFMLIFATAAALALTQHWQLGYAQLIPYATPGFVAFGLAALPAGWLADRWSRDGMMVVYFVGIGAASVATGFANSPVQIAVGLFFIGVFGSIYHPVGLALVTTRWRKTGMRIAVNGVWGNLGVGCTALITGFLIAHLSWRVAFILPGVVSIGLGAVYARVAVRVPPVEATGATGPTARIKPTTSALWRVSVVVFLTAILGSVVFQSTTFALPAIFEERLADLAQAMQGARGFAPASVIGFLAFSVFAAASLAQLVVGHVLDRHGAGPALMCVTALQCVFFLLMLGQTGAVAYAMAVGFMIGVFGQIPINDYLIGTLAAGKYRARVFGMRYLISFTVLALTLPLLAVVHDTWGFDMLFALLAGVAALLCAVSLLIPRQVAPPVS